MQKETSRMGFLSDINLCSADQISPYMSTEKNGLWINTMSFITYSLSFYENKLNAIEHNVVTDKSIYRAKKLSKMLDDLVDEGYTEL